MANKGKNLPNTLTCYEKATFKQHLNVAFLVFTIIVFRVTLPQFSGAT